MREKTESIQEQSRGEERRAEQSRAEESRGEQRAEETGNRTLPSQHTTIQASSVRKHEQQRTKYRVRGGAGRISSCYGKDSLGNTERCFLETSC